MVGRRWTSLATVALASAMLAGGAGAQERQRVEALESEWRDLGNGVVLDTVTGLEWTQHDNGTDVNWQQAMAYCAELALAGGGWSLPQIEELEGLYQSELPGVPCGRMGARGPVTCGVAQAFRLTYWWFWSANLTDQGVWLTNYDTAGRTHTYYLLPDDTACALCVRPAGQ